MDEVAHLIWGGYTGNFGKNVVKCDVLEGHCSCGGYHKSEDVEKDTVLFDKKLLPKFIELMREYKFQEIGKSKYKSHLGVGIFYQTNVFETQGKAIFSGPRKFIFNLENLIAEDLKLNVG